MASTKYIIWLRFCRGHWNDLDDIPEDYWVEQGDGPLTAKQAERISREISAGSGFWIRTLTKPVGLNPNDFDKTSSRHHTQLDATP
jgi:hypothetical protein